MLILSSIQALLNPYLGDRVTRVYCIRQRSLRAPIYRTYYTVYRLSKTRCPPSLHCLTHQTCLSLACLVDRRIRISHYCHRHWHRIHCGRCYDYLGRSVGLQQVQGQTAWRGERSGVEVLRMVEMPPAYSS